MLNDEDAHSRAHHGTKGTCENDAKWAFDEDTRSGTRRAGKMGAPTTAGVRGRMRTFPFAFPLAFSFAFLFAFLFLFFLEQEKGGKKISLENV